MPQPSAKWRTIDMTSLVGKRELNNAVPFRSENERRQVVQNTMRIRFPLPLQAPQRRFPRPRFPQSGHDEFWQHSFDRVRIACLPQP